MEMYRTANPGMTVRPRPWPRGVASSTELFSVQWRFVRKNTNYGTEKEMQDSKELRNSPLGSVLD